MDRNYKILYYLFLQTAAAAAADSSSREKTKNKNNKKYLRESLPSCSRFLGFFCSLNPVSEPGQGRKRK
jgi:hypothetical protein